MDKKLPHKLLRAILNIEQEAAFKKHLKGRDPADLELCTDGFIKNVFMDKDCAYLFFRNHVYYADSAAEIKIYRWFAKHNIDKVPALIKNIKDPVLSPYDVPVVKRLYGRCLGDYLPDLTTNQRVKIFTNLAEFIADYHLKSHAHPPRLPKVPQNEWLFKALSGQAKIPTAAEELLALPAVLVHNDIHESQLFLDEDCNIIGLIDWGHSFIGNPILDFNFNEWLPYYPVKSLFMEQIDEIRAVMLDAYTAKTGFKISENAVREFYRAWYAIYAGTKK